MGLLRLFTLCLFAISSLFLGNSALAGPYRLGKFEMSLPRDFEVVKDPSEGLTVLVEASSAEPALISLSHTSALMPEAYFNDQRGRGMQSDIIHAHSKSDAVATRCRDTKRSKKESINLTAVDCRFWRAGKEQLTRKFVFSHPESGTLVIEATFVASDLERRNSVIDRFIESVRVAPRNER